MIDAAGPRDALQTIDGSRGDRPLGLTGVVLIVRRWRRAAPALRRVLWPVLATEVSRWESGRVRRRLHRDGVPSTASAPSSSQLRCRPYRVPRRDPSHPPRPLVRVRARGRARGGAPLRDALAGALGDPELDVVYWLDWRQGLGGAGWVDLQGRQRAGADGRRASGGQARRARRSARRSDRLRPRARRRARAPGGGHRRGRARAPERPAAGRAARRGRATSRPSPTRRRASSSPSGPTGVSETSTPPRSRQPGTTRPTVRGASTSGTSSSSPASATG